MITYLFRHLSQIFRIADYFVINIFLYISNIHFFPGRKSGLFITDYSAQFIIVNFSWFIVTTFTKLYAKETLRDSLLQFYALTKSYFTYILFFLIYLVLKILTLEIGKILIILRIKDNIYVRYARKKDK